MQLQRRRIEPVIRTREYGVLTRIQATLGILSIFCMLLSTPNTLTSQEIIPDLQTSEYDRQFMNQFYGQVYFQNNLTSWTNHVESYVGTARAAWEASVDAAINSYVDSITTSDSFNTVEAYKDYVLKEMQSQKSQALLNWEDEANRHFLENQSEFVTKLNTNRVDSSYLSRIGQQSLYNQYLNNLTITQNLQNQVAMAASNWQNTYNQNYQQGLNDFASSITNITQQYESIKNSIAQNHSIFQQNLDTINQYKTAVINSIKGMLDNFQSDLNSGVSCNLDGGCTYHQKGGALNDAGELLKDFLDQMRPKVESVALDPSLFFSEISSSFSTFLQAQKDIANNKYEFHESNILTYQNSTGINYDTYRNYSEADIQGLMNSIIHQQYGGGAAIFSSDLWTYEGHGGGALQAFQFDSYSPTFNYASDNSELYQAIYNSIVHNGNYSEVQNFLQGKLGSNYEVTKVLKANIYSDWNNASNSDGLAWLYISKSQGNLALEGKAFAFWTAARAIPPYVAWTHYFQMGALQAGLLYEVKDKNQEALATHWNGTTSSLGNQLSLFTDQIAPAIANWEAQVKSYNDFYTAWQAEADQLEADAEAQYEQSLANLEKEKTAWLIAMEKERNDGMTQWTNLYQQAGQMQNQSDYVNFVNNANATVTRVGTGDIATNTGSIVSKFDNAIDQLSQRKFDVEPPAPQSFTATPAAEEGKFFAGGSSGGFSGLGGAVRSIQENFLKGTTNYIENKLGSVFGVGSFSPVSGSGGSYSILGAASEKKVDTTLSVNGKDVFNHFQETTNGVYQYAQILSVNENNENMQRMEQQKLINQNAYVVNWDARTEGSLSTTNQSYLDQMNSFQCNRGCSDYQAAFQARFQSEIEELKRQGLEYMNGKLVKSLTLEEKILVGQVDYQSLTDDQKKDFGKCFANPSEGSCGQLLVKEFDYSINEVSNVATLTKRISDGSIAGKDTNGYYSGKKDEVRHISLTNLAMVNAPAGKGLFDVWGEADWQSFADASSNALNDFYKNLSSDGKKLADATTSIRKTEAANEKAFQERKTAQEKNDSLIQELALAYFTGGAAGVQASIKGKIEDHINMELAKAWISATGGSEEDLQMASQLIEFMRGRMEMRDLKSSQNTYVGLNKPLDFLNPISMYEQYYKVSVQALNAGMSHLGNAWKGSIEVINNITGGAYNMARGLLFSAVGATVKPFIGNERFETFVDSATVKQRKFAELKAQEESLVRSVTSQGISSATGIPLDLVSSWVNDKAGERAAAKANRFAGNAVLDVATQVVGVVGGLVKTVFVATGIKEREIQETLAQGNRLANAGTIEPSSAHMASLGLNEQLFGMKATGTSYSSSVVDINNKEAVQEELNKLVIANHIAVTMGIDPSIAKGFVDKGYADHQRRENERKAQAAAIEQVAVTAATTALTLGAGAALSAMVTSANATISAIGTAIVNFGNTVGSAVTGFFGSAAQATTATVTNAMGAAVNVGSTAVNTISAMANALVQGAIGSKNGTEGALAGIANGLLGGITKLAGKFESGILNGITPGIGVTYHPENGWGGSIGLGNTTSNVSIAFSKEGNTTLQGSYSIGHGVQLAGDVTTNGAANIGLNYNPTGEGPRRDWNFSLMYDMAGTGLSASVGYTNPNSTIGLTSTVNRDGLSTSAELTGVSIATNGPDGFQMDEINFAEQNINAAQDQTQNDQNKAKLLASGDFTPADIAKMSDSEIQKALNGLNKEAPNAIDSVLNIIGEYIDTNMNAGIDLAVNLGMTIASGAALLYGSGGTSGTPTANSGETVVMERTRREEEEGDDPNPEEGNDQQNESLPMSEMTMIDGGSITLDREPAYGQSIVPVTIATGTHSSEITSNQQVTARGGEVTKPKPYPIDPSLNAKPITVQKEVYSLSDSDKKAIAELKTKLSGIKVSDNEPEMVKTREAIAYKNNYFIENLGKVGTEIQDLKEKIDRTKKEIDDLKKGNGLFTSTVDPTVLQMNLTSDLQKLETLNKEYNSIQGKYQDYNTKDTKKEMDHARELALTRLQDSVIENPFRQELRLNELALMGMEKGTFEYKETDARIKILKDNVSEFEKAKDLLLNSSGDMQAKAAEYMLSVNPNLTIPYPTHKTETLTLSNSQAQPGFFSSPKFEGVLPGANVPGAIVSANEEDHKARHGISDYYAVDIALPHGTPYNAVAPGIAEVKYDDPKRGNYVKITHDHGLSTIYMHNSDFLVDDSKPVAVDPTTPIARVGNTGNTRSDYPKGPPLNGGSHIHFEIHLDGKRVPINSFDWDRYKNEGKTYLDEVRKRLEK